MKIGIVCYASVGGSGVVATELAHALAGRGHQVHLLSSEVPFRWRNLEGLHFERVETPAYPLFREPQYLLALATAIARVACDRRLDIVHAHYAVPHATAAYLADQILSADGAGSPPKTVTTLHGTDITLVGSDASYRRVVAFSIEQSAGVTAVSKSLRRDTMMTLGTKRDIRVIPNFIDCTQYRKRVDPDIRRRLSPAGESVVMHVSNFRPVKRLDVVLDVFLQVRRKTPARLVLVGDGPDREPLETRVRHLGLTNSVLFAGEQQDLVGWLSSADLFLLPSSQESFGMAALEAMACEVPVVASHVGGLPELVHDGETGFLCEVNDVGGMAERAIVALTDRDLRARMTRAAVESVRSQYCTEAIVPMYEAFYQEIL
jgi:N-acetyl-alpha-D-glucosaminyl L-malate synthase BshA